MRTSSKYLPAEERRAMTVEAVVDLAAEQNPINITTAATFPEKTISCRRLWSG